MVVDEVNERDQSEPAQLPAGAGVALRVGPRWEGEASGVVATIAAGEEPAPRGGLPATTHRVRVGLGGADELTLVLPLGVEAPLVIGERVDVCARSEVIGIHPVTDLWIRVGDEPRLVCSDRGDPTLAPGWTIGPAQPRELPPARPNGMATRVNLPVVFQRGAAVGAVSGNLWRRLQTREGLWWIGGYAVAWGPGNLPPDASAHFRYSLIRGFARSRAPSSRPSSDGAR